MPPPVRVQGETRFHAVGNRSWIPGLRKGDPGAENQARIRGWLEGNPQRDRGQLVGILRKIPEEGLSAAARGSLFPERKVRRSRGAQAKEKTEVPSRGAEGLRGGWMNRRRSLSCCPPGPSRRKLRWRARCRSPSPTTTPRQRLAEFGTADPRPGNSSRVGGGRGGRGRVWGSPRLDLGKGRFRGNTPTSALSECGREGSGPCALGNRSLLPLE